MSLCVRRDARPTQIPLKIQSLKDIGITGGWDAVAGRMGRRKCRRTTVIDRHSPLATRHSSRASAVIDRRYRYPPPATRHPLLPFSLRFNSVVLNFLDMANNMAIFRSMTHTANIGLIKNQFSQFIGKVQNGDTVVVCARNKPVAKIVSMCRPLNRTMEGFDPRVEIFADLEGPLIPLDQWRMLAD